MWFLLFLMSYQPEECVVTGTPVDRYGHYDDATGRHHFSIGMMVLHGTVESPGMCRIGPDLVVPYTPAIPPKPKLVCRTRYTYNAESGIHESHSYLTTDPPNKWDARTDQRPEACPPAPVTPR